MKWTNFSFAYMAEMVLSAQGIFKLGFHYIFYLNSTLW